MEEATAEVRVGATAEATEEGMVVAMEEGKGVGWVEVG
jgi:hypothetical protein